MKINQEGLDLIKRFEGFSPKVYICSGGWPTIGYGHVVRGDEGLNIPLSEKDGTRLLRDDVGIAERAVRRLIKAPLNENQFSALVSFTFNLGSGNLQASTLRRKLNRGDYDGASAEFPKWRKAGGRILKGLVRRRAEERGLFERAA